MEAFVALALLCALAARWSVDGRESLRCKEQELAALVLTWPPAAPARTRTAYLAAQVDRLLRWTRPSDDTLRLQVWTDRPGLEGVAGRLAEYRREVEREHLARAAADPAHSLGGQIAPLLRAVASRLDPDGADWTDRGRRVPGVAGGRSEGCPPCLG
jgi:hypothetical protein